MIHLAGPEMIWLDDTEGFQKLEPHLGGKLDDRDTVLKLKSLIRTHARFMIYEALRDAMDPQRTLDGITHATNGQDQSFPMFGAQDLVQRNLGESFSALPNIELDSPPYPQVNAHDCIADLGGSLLAFHPTAMLVLRTYATTNSRRRFEPSTI